MKNALQLAIEKHLGREVAPEPTLYEVLAVKEDATLDEITNALRLAAAAWNKSDTKTDPSSAQLAAKTLKLAQATLLDHQKRVAYNSSIQPTKKTNVSTEDFFPQADPLAEFDPSACLVGAGTTDRSMEFGSVQERWETLRRSIPSLSHSAWADSARNESVEDYEAVPEHTSSHTESRSAIDRIEQLKRIRRRRNAMSVVGVVGLALLFLGYAGVRFVWNRMALQEQEIAQANRPVETEPENSAGAMNTPPKKAEPRPDRKKESVQKSNTPKSSGLPALIKDPSAEKSEVPMQSDPFNATPAKLPDMPVMTPPVPAMTPMPEPKPTMTPPVEMKPEDMKPADGKPADTQPAPLSVPAPKPEMAMSTPKETKEWSETMKKARRAIEKADFENFHKLMEAAFELSKSDEAKAKQARLDQLGQLYEIFISSMREAKSKTRGTEVITVGKNKVNIVESKENELVVRIQGKTERYAWDSLPPGVAMAMADLTLSEQDPTDLAARAVYFSLSPARNDLTTKKVKDWFEKSVGKGKIREDLPQALTDKYE